MTEEWGSHLYYRKYKKLKIFAKDLIFQNAAICDEVETVEAQIAATEEENRCLAKRLVQFEQMAEIRETVPGGVNGGTKLDIGNLSSGKVVSRKVPTAKAKVGQNVDLAKPSISKLKKRPKGATLKKAVPLLPLDEFGRPILPLELGELTVHSLGEIVFDKASFHCAESLYPVGFCSTRVYASNDDANTKCLYTCKISDEDSHPLFEISPEECPDEVYRGTSPEQSLLSLIKSLPLGNKEIQTSHTDSLEFFGLNHPIIKNLIQSCPGAKKCREYRWVKFEINKELAPENIETDDRSPGVSYRVLLEYLQT